MTVAPVVPVSSSDVNVIAEVVLEGSESEFVESQTFALSRKREAFFVENRKRHEYRKNTEKHPEERSRGQHHSRARSRHLRARRCEGRWKTKRITVAEWNTEANIGGRRATKQSWREWNTYLHRSESLEVDIEELQDYLLGPEELDVDVRHIALNARGEKHQRLSTQRSCSKTNQQRQNYYNASFITHTSC